MGKYVSWDDVVARYGMINQVGGAAEVGSAYIYYAEAELESRLAQHFTVPFSDNNITAKDLSIDLTLAKLLAYKDTKKYDLIMGQINERIDRLINKDDYMVTTSGDSLVSDQSGQMWSSTSGYLPTFDNTDPIDLEIDPDLVQDEFDAKYNS